MAGIMPVAPNGRGVCAHPRHQGEGGSPCSRQLFDVCPGVCVRKGSGRRGSPARSGAGMNRPIGAANVIHNNMPNGTTWQTPALSDQDAWDVAAFVQAQPRPKKANLDRDYPVALERPADSGYGPYVDGFSQEQHRLGPFAPIRAKIKAMLTAASAVPSAR